MTDAINAAALEIIKRNEGLRLEAYPDPATGGDPWTVGVGHTGPEVTPRMVITEAQAKEFLQQDCEEAERCIAKHVTIPLNQNQFDALVSFVFNLGCGNFSGSTLLKMVNDGNFQAAAAQFGRWNKAAGKVMVGLTLRREAESELFLA